MVLNHTHGASAAAPSSAGAGAGAGAVCLPARLTKVEARATLAALRPQLAGAAEPVIDASALQELDTAALALLLDCQRQAQAQGRQLQVLGAPPKLSELAQLYGVAQLLAL